MSTLFRHRDQNGVRHFYSFNLSEPGWIYDQGACDIYDTQPNPPAAALSRFVNNSTGDHLFTLNPSEVANQPDYKQEVGVFGYIWPAAQTGFHPFSKAWHPRNQQHFYTLAPQSITPVNDWHIERVLGYVSLATTDPVDLKYYPIP